jgi:TrmH family RNA methyltransferase
MITSSHNPKIQYIRSLLNRRVERENSDTFVIEGVRLAEEVISSGWQVEMVLYTHLLTLRGQQLLPRFAKVETEIEEVTPEIMHSIAGTDSPQGILAVIRKKTLPLPENPDFVVIIDAVRDPGNLGTLLRSALAAKVQAVLLIPGTVDAFSPKVVRSAMGATFRLPVHIFSWDQIQDFCLQQTQPKLSIMLAEIVGGSSCWESDLCQPLALIIGGEANGASHQARIIAEKKISIPMPGSSESLNAAVAGSILIFEIVRQRLK